MRANRTTIAAMLSIALAVAPSVVAAQAADEELKTPNYWTSIDTEVPGFTVPGGETATFDWGYRTTVGRSYTVEADDPRISGDVDIALVFDFANSGMFRGVGRSRNVNEEGTFEGTVHVVGYPDGSQFRMVVAEGKDGYEGLTYTMTSFLDPSGEGQTQGLIWEGEAPPLPDADALPE